MKKNKLVKLIISWLFLHTPLKKRGFDAVKTALIQKKRSELFLLYLSELPSTSLIESLGRKELERIEYLNEALSEWDDIYKGKSESYQYLLEVYRTMS